eukprot:TRINITY_DN3983_c0_g2_i1.p1 TRINITY_DN3983_c0_g2~~TRINITY_DN3983_c0_g2_i1.p1  ORF type:complete len:204 (+),score=22.14 TRINITY_DN3983_c0_g2_i1:64-612(+)
MHSTYLKAAGYLVIVLLLVGAGWSGPLYESGVVLQGETDGCLSVGVWTYELCTEEGCGVELPFEPIRRMLGAGRGVFAWCVVISLAAMISLVCSTSRMLYYCIEIFGAFSIILALVVLLCPPFVRWGTAFSFTTVSYKPASIYLYLCLFVYTLILRSSDDAEDAERECEYKSLPQADNDEYL